MSAEQDRRRHRLGALAWLASLIVLPAQLVVALRWPDGYSITRNAISDLGVTACTTFSEQGNQVREVCSPWHPVFNAAMVATGLLMAVGALLLLDFWDTRTGRAAMVLAAVAGVFLVLVGLAPWDTRPDLHDLAALGQAVAQWAAMVLVAIAAGRGALRWVTAAALIVSVLGFVAFLAAVEGTEIAVVGFGGSERLAFDTLSLWVGYVGLTVWLRLRGRSRQDSAADPVRA